MRLAGPAPSAEPGGQGRALPKRQLEEARALRGEMATGEPVTRVQPLVPSSCKKGVEL